MGGSLAVIALGWWWCRVYPIMAQAYGQENFSTAALLLATIASFFTLTDVLWAFHHFAYTL